MAYGAPNPPKKGHVTEIVLGAVIGVVTLPMATLVVGYALGSLFGSIGLVAGPVLLLAVGAGLLVRPRTRPWGLGLLIGAFGTLIVLGGACVALFTALDAANV